jgi:hypothetical protein
VTLPSTVCTEHALLTAGLRQHLEIARRSTRRRTQPIRSVSKPPPASGRVPTTGSGSWSRPLVTSSSTANAGQSHRSSRRRPTPSGVSVSRSSALAAAKSIRAKPPASARAATGCNCGNGETLVRVRSQEAPSTGADRTTSFVRAGRRAARLDVLSANQRFLSVHSGRQPRYQIRGIPRKTKGIPTHKVMPEEGLEPPTRGL